jgi:glycerate-2-kinase
MKKVPYPLFEMVSCPSINLRELKEKAQKGKLSSVIITDKVSGKRTTVGKMYKGLIGNLVKMGLEAKRDLSI